MKLRGERKMARNARRLSSCNIYHVMIRGNDKKDIFLDVKDRKKFLKILEKIKCNNYYYNLAYCLMSNHVHLLIREGSENISQTMKRLNVTYAYYFNHKYNHIGHLFQDRFRSEIIEDDNYLLVAARYIHNNPVKAGLIDKPEDYPWSSYRAYINKDEESIRLIDRDLLLGIISNDQKDAVKQLIEFTNETQDDLLIDVDCNEQEKTASINDSDVRDQTIEILRQYEESIDCLRSCQNKKERNTRIREIKEHTGASLRQLSDILGISKDIIFRA
jgi:REP element-mobilizing transposase RayT